VDGRIWEGDVGNNDDGASFTAQYISRAGDIKIKNLPEINRFRHIHILYDTIPGAVGVVTVSYAIDDPDGAYTTVGTFTAATGSVKNFDCNGRGLRIFVKVETTSMEAFVLRGVQITGHPVGRYR